MKTLINDIEKTIIIQKSKFITYTKKVFTENDAKKILEELRNKYSDATHVCYAYIIDNQKKYSDDGEPASTAGKPILEVLEKNNLNYVISVVIRYFGGIKLGSNGLIRAYSNSCKETLFDNIKDISYGYKIIIEEDYTKEKIISYLLKDSIILKKDYTNKIYIKAIIKKEILDSLSNISFTIIEEVIL